MKKGKITHTTIKVISILLLVFIIVNIATYVITGKNLINYFFIEEKMDEIWGMLEKEGTQYVKVDDYTITLEEYLYDEDTETGYTKFSVVREGGDMRKDRVNDIGGFGINESSKNGTRFLLRVEGSGSYISSWKKEKGVMYIYYKYTMSEGDKIYLYDINAHEVSWREKENAIYIFELKDNVKTNKYIVKDKGSKFYMSLTKFSMHIKKSGYIGKIEEMTIHYDNGEKYVIIKNGSTSKGILSTAGSENNIHTYGLNFEKTIDIDSISYITYNGKKIEPLPQEKEVEVEEAYDKIKNK